MAGITQTIPNYIQGISQQPDELKIPGQVNDALNVLPNITKGLEKRPGSEFIATLKDRGSTGGDKYFVIDQDEKYIGRIQKSGLIQIWDFNGTEYGVNVGNNPITYQYDPTDPTKDKKHELYETPNPHGAGFLDLPLSNSYLDFTIKSINVTIPGSGYTSVPTVTISAPPSGGTQAVATAVVTDEKVTSLTITNAGEGYTSAPTITIAAPTSGTQAEATASCFTPYLEHVGDDSIQFLNINDYTFITNREVRPEMSDLTPDTNIDDSILDSDKGKGGWEFKKRTMSGRTLVDYKANLRPKEAYIELKQIAYNKQYGLNFHQKGASKKSISRAKKLTVQWWGTAANATSYSPTGDVTYGPLQELQDKTTTVVDNAGTGSSYMYESTPPNSSKDGTCRYTAREIFTINPTGKSYLNGKESDRRKYGPLVKEFDTLVDGAAVFNLQATDKPDFSDVVEYNPHPMMYSEKDSNGDYTPRKDKVNLRFELKNTGTPKAVASEYECDYNVDIKLIHGGEGWKTGDHFFVVMEGTNYKIDVVDHEVIGYEASLGAIRPAPTSSSADEVVTADGILESIMAEFDRKMNPKEIDTNYHYESGATGNPRTGEGWPWAARRIGNGIYFRMYTSDKINGVADNTYDTELDWTVTASDSKLINVLTDEVNDVGDLPTNCRHGYVVKVVNSTSDKDDYYLQFKSQSAPEDGPGVWEECVKPGIRTEVAVDTMPHQLVRYRARAGKPAFFELQPVKWAGRLVGDDNTNPTPSFLLDTQASEFNLATKEWDKQVGHPIQNMAFYRNRIALLANDSIVLSQAGDYFNFWAKTAMTISPADSIDLSVGDTKPATLVHSISTQKGLLLFSKEKQFLLTTDNDVLSPETAKILSISTFNYNDKVQPFSLGTTIGFLNNVSSNTKFMEMTNISNPSQTEVIEQSKLVSSLMPNTVDSVAESKEDGLILFATRDADENVYGYKWFNTGEKRLLASWFRWTMHGNTIFHTIMDGVYYAVVKVDDDALQLQKIDLKTRPKLDSQLVDYPIHMDNMTLLTSSHASNETTFAVPREGSAPDTNFSVAGNKRFTIFAVDGPMKGQSEYPRISGSEFKLNGNWSTSTVYGGYTYDMKVEFPVPYLKQSEGDAVRADTRASTIIHRVDLNLGPTGYHQTRLKRKRRNDWIQDHEASLNYGFEENRYYFLDSTKTTIPVYARNGDFKLSLESNHPSPCTLYSSFWEGDYNQRYYKKV